MHEDIRGSYKAGKQQGIVLIGVPLTHKPIGPVGKGSKSWVQRIQKEGAFLASHESPAPKKKMESGRGEVC